MNRVGTRGARVGVLVGVLVAALALAGVARAENSVLAPSNGAMPWTDPAHQSPLETYASQVATQIGGRTVRVQCHGISEWSALGSQWGFDPARLVGFVGWYYSPFTNRVVRTEDIVHLHESVCLPLQKYAEASAKPTRCDTTQTVERVVTKTVKVKKRIRVRVRVNGKLVWRWKVVLRNKQVRETIYEEVPGPRVPCYGTAGRNAGAVTPADYRDYAWAIYTLAHELVHIKDVTVGSTVLTSAVAESRAACFGMQMTAQIAAAFGGDADDGNAIGNYVWVEQYPHLQGGDYWSADCRQDGPLDLTPGDGVWL
jgi:hypothetical protein